MRKAFCIVFCAVLLLNFITVHGADTVYISTQQQLCALSARVNSGDSMEGIEVCLTASISLTAPFTPIGADPSTPFSGSFNGGGNTVSGLTVQCTEGYGGLFGCVAGGGIRDLSVVNASINGGDYCGAIAGRVYTYGGTVSISNCTATGTVVGGSYAGGLVGYSAAAAHGVYAAVSINGCTFNGTVNGDMYVGGVLGKADAVSTNSRAEVAVEDCKTQGGVTAAGRYGTMAGGICGGLSSKSNGGSSHTAVTRCLSYADARASKAASGGLCGALGADGFGATATLGQSVAFGAVYSAALAGGAAGQCRQESDGTATVTGCVAGGNVLGGDVYPVASGTGISACFTAADSVISYPIEAECPTYIKGDTNGDTEVDNADAALILKYDAGIALLGIAATAAGDVNADSLVDNTDAALILKFDAGLVSP